MTPIYSLFGRSPFEPLKRHMKKVATCVHKLEPLFYALEDKKMIEVQRIADEIFHLEHDADRTRNEIKNNLPSNFFLSINKTTFLEILLRQDEIANCAEDIAVLVTLRPLEFYSEFKSFFFHFIRKNIECFDQVYIIIQELHDLLESSFGGCEAENVQNICEEVSKLEHETDILQRTLLRHFYNAESKMTYGEFFHWQKIFQAISDIANLSEKLAQSVRMSLDVN